MADGRRLILAIAAAALLAAGAPPARCGEGSRDDLAGHDWEGEHEWLHLESGGTSGTPATPPAVPGGGGGTATPPAAGGGTATPPATGEDGAAGPTAGGTGEEPAPGGTVGPAPTGPAPAGPSVPFTPTPAPLPSCTAKWVLEVDAPAPALHEEETLLTLVLFRTDAFAFVCQAYCRSESTWYADWFATTKASRDGTERFSVKLRLDSPCPNCRPVIDCTGASSLSTQAQVRARWGGVDGSTSAMAAASTAWMGPLDASDSCSATARCAGASSRYGVELAGLEAENTETASYSYASAIGGKAASQEVRRTETEVTIRDSAEVVTYAGGTEDNAQAKARAGYDLLLKGTSQCGPWGEYEVALVQR